MLSEGVEYYATRAVVYIRQAAVNRDKWVLLFTNKMTGVVPVLLVVRY